MKVFTEHYDEFLDEYSYKMQIRFEREWGVVVETIDTIEGGHTGREYGILINAFFPNAERTFAANGVIGGYCYPQGHSCGSYGGEIHFRGNFESFRKLVAKSAGPAGVLHDARVSFYPYA